MKTVEGPFTTPAYRLDELGWLQFERLCDLVLEREARLTDLTWLGTADRGRVAVVDRDVVLEQPAARLTGPVAVAVLWVRPDPSLLKRPRRLIDKAGFVRSELADWFERVLVLTNLDGPEAHDVLSRGFSEIAQLVVLGPDELGRSLDRYPDLRAALPSVLGLRDLEPLISPEARTASTLDLGAAQELARVFWPTKAYERARMVLGQHRFVVLTGPPEMGKTAVARMLALAQLTSGWEAHECTRPEQVWSVFDRDRAQVFVADDAFGSTEYRPDSAELWARELGRMLGTLDDRHWLIWTSRPAPLKAGLRRVQRERGAERFPAPAEVLVDAGALDLAEKTLILFRHAKGRRAGAEACTLLRSAGVSIVEHPHFTPERIRRFVSERLDQLPAAAGGRDERRVLALVENELSRPTDAMRTSFGALDDEHRELLIALLDAPAGLIDERQLTATVRRHRMCGLTRPPSELIDRLTDHFLRLTPLGIGWVHPSWRDLVIDELHANQADRQRFLSACGVYGVLLAFSREGGPAGERSLPLLSGDRDWDALGDRIAELLPELEDQDLTRLLLALGDAVSAELEPTQHDEAESLTRYVLGALSRAWSRQTRPLPVFLLEAWYTTNSALPEHADPPPIARTWSELHPSRSQVVGELTAGELQAIDDWLALAQILAVHDSETLARTHFHERDQQLLGHLSIELGHIRDGELRPLAQTMLRRIGELAPAYRDFARATLTRLTPPPSEERWWVPRDLDAPPSTEPVAHARTRFTRADVDRVLADL
jgi:hypothetical protein